jgi:two-component system chemotaxis response regulator CheY
MKVLAVEDQPEYLEMLQMVMNGIGHSIIVAKDGIEALRILEKEKIDVIMSDVAMPTMDGIELHKMIRAKPEHKDTPFIFLTGVTNLKEIKKECSSPKDLLLQKPISVERLLKMFSGQIKPFP